MGSNIIPLSDFLTFSTKKACSFGVWFLCIIPIPPSLAIEIAVSDSVTVSIAELKRGVLSFMFLVRFVEISTSLGSTSDLDGTKRTSSKVWYVLKSFSNIYSPYLPGKFIM